jgi:hypothetical protein
MEFEGLFHFGGSMTTKRYLAWTDQGKSNADIDARFGQRGINVKDAPYNATGDGVTDDSAAIQAAINACAAGGGGRVFIPTGTYVCVGLLLPSYVTIEGQTEWTYPLYPDVLKGTVLQQKATGGGVISLATTYPTYTSSAGVRNLIVRGNGSAVAGKGINFGASNFYGGIRGVFVTNFADEGIWLAGIAGRLTHSLVSECVLSHAALGAFKGAVTIAGTDHEVEYVEVQTSSFKGRDWFQGAPLNAITDANRRCVGWLISSSQAFYTNCIGELSDRGFVVYGTTGVGALGTDPLYPGATNNTFTGCRADHNAAEGWSILNEARGNRFANCWSFANAGGGTADGQYDAWSIGSGSSNEAGNKFVNCDADWEGSPFAPWKVRYGWYHGASTNMSTSPQSRNKFVNITSIGHLTKWWMDSTVAHGDDLCPWPTVPDLTPNIFLPADGQTTPSVDQCTRLQLSNSAPTTVTNFTNGFNGQLITVNEDTGNTTIANNANIKPLSWANTKLHPGEIRTFRYYRGVWYEQGAPTEGFGFYWGDAGTALAFFSARNQYWSAPLTAPRTVVLGTTAAAPGDRFHIVRLAAATGASALIIGATGRSLYAGQWCDVIFDGTNWTVDRLGALITAAAITAPTAPSAGYVQAEAASAKTAIDAIRAALTANGITL